MNDKLPDFVEEFIADHAHLEVENKILKMRVKVLEKILLESQELVAGIEKTLTEASVCALCEKAAEILTNTPNGMICKHCIDTGEYEEATSENSDFLTDEFFENNLAKSRRTL